MRSQAFRWSVAGVAPIVLVWLIVSTRVSGQGGAQTTPVQGSGRPQAPIGGCPRTSQQFYPCAKTKAQAFNPPRTPDGKPDMRGDWNNPTTTGSQNIEDYPGDGFLGPQTTLIVDPPDGKIPYQPQWATKKQENLKEYIDPFGTCYPPGVPRHVYSPRGHHILQSPGVFSIVSEFAHVYRVIPTDGSPHIGNDIRLYMGDSRGRWEGNTLVVDTTNLTDRTWLDITGDFHSDALHVTERFTLVDPDTIFFETTLEDRKVFTRPWTMAFPLVRAEQGHEVMEEACFEGDHDIPHMLEHYKIYLGLNPPK